MRTINLQQLFWQFVQAREEARVNKSLGIYPHTDDPVLAKFSFCNVNREHDRVTKWVDTHIRQPLNAEGLPKSVAVLRLAVARIFNEPDTLQELLDWPDFDVMKQRVRSLQAAGKRVFRGAYMMPSHGSPEQLKTPPADYYLDSAQTLWGTLQEAETRWRDDSLLYVAGIIHACPGFGPFLTNQVVTDLRYLDHWKQARDWSTFILGGPGTSRGLCRFFDAKLTITMNQALIRDRLMLVRDLSLKELPPEPYQTYFLDPNNLSNCFCEFDKYARAVLGEGRVKKHYKPTP